VDIAVGTSWSGGNFSNNGTVTIADHVSFLVPATTPPSTFTNGATGTVSTTGDASSGDLFVAGNTFDEAGATTGSPVFVSGTTLNFVGSGASSINAWGSNTLAGTIAPQQTLTVEGVGCVTDSSVTDKSNLTLNGALILTAVNCHGANATVSMTGPSGNNSINVGTTGSLSWAKGPGGARTVSGQVRNAGTVTASGIASLSISGSYTQDSTGTYMVTVNAPNSSSKISTKGAAVLGGSLVAVLSKGFTPSPGQSWTNIFTAASRTGSFTSTKGPGGTWTSTALATSVSLRFT
jgi:hypothetical protein